MSTYTGINMIAKVVLGFKKNDINLHAYVTLTFHLDHLTHSRRFLIKNTKLIFPR